MRAGLMRLMLGAGALAIALDVAGILLSEARVVLTFAISLILVLPTVGLLWVLLSRGQPGAGNARYPVGTILLVTITVLLLM